MLWLCFGLCLLFLVLGWIVGVVQTAFGKTPIWIAQALGKRIGHHD